MPSRLSLDGMCGIAGIESDQLLPPSVFTWRSTDNYLSCSGTPKSCPSSPGGGIFTPFLPHLVHRSRHSGRRGENYLHLTVPQVAYY